MKKKGRWIPVIGCLMLVLFLAGCGKTIDIQSTAEQEIPSQNQIVVGVSQLGSESMWHSCFLCEIVIRSQFHTTYEPEA